MTLAEVTPEQAKQVLEDAQRARLEQCQAEMDALLEKHSCRLSVQLLFSPDGRVIGNVVLIDAS
jgi:hypothetical protein